MKRTHINPQSVKQLNRQIEYSKKRKAWMQQHTNCEAKLSSDKARCTKKATQVHHMQGRTGSLLLDSNKWLAVCHNCHRWITDNNGEAINMGLSIRRNGPIVRN